MWTRAELKENAKRFVKFNYWKMVVAGIALTIAIGGGASSSSSNVRNQASEYGSSVDVMLSYLSYYIGIVAVIMLIAAVIGVFVLNPLEVGGRRFFVVSHYQKAELGELGYGFTHSYGNVALAMFLRQLFTFLWSLLFVIPGIIKSYEYRMIPFILAENPETSYQDAFAMSKQMMNGNKWNAFVLDLSFIGWMILTAITCGLVGVFWVNPYKYMTDAELYVALKEITFGNGQPQGFQNNNQGYDDSVYVQNNNQ